MTRAAVVLFGIAALLLVAAVPDALVVKEDQVVFLPSAIVDDVSGYLRGLVTGDAFTYEERYYTRKLGPRVADRALRSFVYLAVSSLAAVTIGLIAGIWVTARRRHGVREALTSAAAVPDFVVALLLQIGVVALYKWTGFRVAHVVSLTVAEPALLLPVVTLALIPMITVMRTVSARAYLVAAEDHTRVAKSLGLKPWRIYLSRITPIVLVFVKADIPRLAGAMLGNLFIVEYLFNVRGVTTFVFSRGLTGGYQYDLVMNAFVMTAILYAALSVLLRVYVSLIGRVVVRL